jgi:signal transduction histidine kinase
MGHPNFDGRAQATLRAFSPRTTETRARRLDVLRSHGYEWCMGGRRTRESKLVAAAERAAQSAIETLADGAIVMLASRIGPWLVPAAVAHKDEVRALTLREIAARPAPIHAPLHAHALASTEPRIFSPEHARDAELGEGLAQLRASLSSIGIAQLRGRRQVLGTLTVLRDRGRPELHTQDRILLKTIAASAGRLLEESTTGGEADRSRIDAALAVDDLAAALSAPMDAEQIARVTVEIVSRTYSACLVEVVIERPDTAPLIFGTHTPSQSTPSFAHSAAAAVLAHEQEVFAATPAAWICRFGHEAELCRMEVQLGGLACVPLVVGDRRIGAVTVVVPRDDLMLLEGRALLRRMAKLAAQALVRARLAAAEHRAHARWALLAEASSVVASLDRDRITASLVSVIVPGFADGCAVDVAKEDGLARVAQVGDELPPPSLAAVHAPRHACIPIVSRDQTFGAFVVVRRASRAPFDGDDRLLVAELARRCALAFDNARLYDDARRAVAARDRFLSIAGHELRTPLSALNIYVYSLVARRDDTRHELATRQIQRLDHLVDRLLDVSRLTSGRLVIDRAPVDLAEIVDDVLKQMEPQARALHVDIGVAVESIVGSWDRTRIEQVLVNLVSNALRYGDGAPIDLIARRIGELARVVVRDKGPGISPELRAHLFERQTHEIARPNHGLGLGLWITRQLVEAHAGTIEVKSEVGQGTEFVVDLPTNRSS